MELSILNGKSQMFHLFQLLRQSYGIISDGDGSIRRREII